MRVLLLGAGGMLASDLTARVPKGVQLACRTYEELDITDVAAVEYVLYALRPDVVVNAAAYTDVDGAERDREQAFAVNADALGILGRVARETDALLVHYSTDYVFSGAADEPYPESHPTAPLGVYGASKLAGERQLAASGARHLTIRTQWLFGLDGRSFPRTMWERATAGQPTRVVNDQVGKPTYTDDLARATWTVLKKTGFKPDEDSRLPATEGRGVILHVANRGSATWYDLAARVFDACGRADLLSPCSTDEYPTPAARPPWSVLSTKAYERVARRPLPRWQNALDRFVTQLAPAGESAYWDAA